MELCRGAIGAIFGGEEEKERLRRVLGEFVEEFVDGEGEGKGVGGGERLQRRFAVKYT